MALLRNRQILSIPDGFIKIKREKCAQKESAIKTKQNLSKDRPATIHDKTALKKVTREAKVLRTSSLLNSATFLVQSRIERHLSLFFPPKISKDKK